MKKVKEKLKIKYDYYKTWLLTSISLFITSSIGIFTVDNGNFKLVLTAIWFISVIMYFDLGDHLSGVICMFAAGFFFPPVLNKINKTNKKIDLNLTNPF